MKIERGDKSYSKKQAQRLSKINDDNENNLKNADG